MMRVLDRVLGRGKGTGQAGRRSEQRAASRVRGRLTRASGCGNQKGDYSKGDFLVEHKSTTALSLRLTYDWLAKIADQAGTAVKKPALHVTFNVGDAGHQRPHGAWVMIPEKLFKELTDHG